MTIKRIITLVVALLATTLSAAPADAARKPPPPSGPMVLWDNGGISDGSIGVSSNNYTDWPYATQDTEASDDFVLKRTSTIQKVEVKGFYSSNLDPNRGAVSLDNGPADSFTVRFYAATTDADGTPLPGAQIGSAQTATAVEGWESTSITLPSPVQLAAGRYWISVVADIAYTLHGSWYWLESFYQREHHAVWRQPSGASTDCTSWCTFAEAWPSRSAGPDLDFTLTGLSS